MLASPRKGGHLFLDSDNMIRYAQLCEIERCVLSVEQKHNAHRTYSVVALCFSGDFKKISRCLGMSVPTEELKRAKQKKFFDLYLHKS